VTPIPGTTRDVIEESVNIRGIPIRAIDTAGLRETSDPVEELGVRRSRAEIAAADLVLLVIDASAGWTAEEAPIARDLAGKRVVVVANKVDLVAANTNDGSTGKHSGIQTLAMEGLGLEPTPPLVATSMLTGAGLEALEGAIAGALVGEGAGADAVLVSNLRHKAGLEGAIAALQEALTSVATGFEQAVVAIDLRIAAEALGEITGETVTEATITEIFARFCVGK